MKQLFIQRDQVKERGLRYEKFRHHAFFVYRGDRESVNGFPVLGLRFDRHAGFAAAASDRNPEGGLYGPFLFSSRRAESMQPAGIFLTCGGYLIIFDSGAVFRSGFREETGLLITATVFAAVPRSKTDCLTRKTATDAVFLF